MTANRKITREEARMVPASLYRVERALEKIRARLKTPVIFTYRPGHIGTIESVQGKVVVQWTTKEELDVVINGIISSSPKYLNALINNFENTP